MTQDKSEDFVGNGGVPLARDGKEPTQGFDFLGAKRKGDGILSLGANGCVRWVEGSVRGQARRYRALHRRPIQRRRAGL